MWRRVRSMRRPSRLVMLTVALLGAVGLASGAAGAGGALDPSFGIGGKVVTQFGDGSVANGVALQPDGRIVAAGYCHVFGGPNLYAFALARYNSDGSLDSSFGTGGKVTTDFGGGSFDVANGVVIQPNGMIVAAGERATLFTSSFALARYNSVGRLDPSFVTGCTVTTDFGGSGLANAVALEPNGKIVAAGAANTNFSGHWALARYN